MKNLREIEVNLSTKNQNSGLGSIKVGLPNSGGYQPQNNYGNKNQNSGKINKYGIGINSSQPSMAPGSQDAQEDQLNINAPYSPTTLEASKNGSQNLYGA